MSSPWWPASNGKISFYHAKENPLLLPSKSDTADDRTHITLADLCRKATPSTCRLNPLLFNGHLQTAWTTISKYHVPIYYKRRIFEAEDASYAGQFAIDFVVPPYEPPSGDEENDNAREFTLPSGLPERTAFFTAEEFAAFPSGDSKPMLVVLHGLTGGSHELYLRHTLAPLVAEGGGWEVCVVNSRGCSQTKITTGILYNARATWDIRQTVKWLRETFPNRPLFAIGFSLGANILTNVRLELKYLGEEGDRCQLKAAVICANPWNLELTSLALRRTWVGLEVYARALGTSLRKLVNDHVEAISKYSPVDIVAAQKIKYIHEFDRIIQGPTWGYPTEGAYHRDASSVDSLLAIRIPFFAIQAEDDPISVKEALPVQEFAQTPYGVMLTTSWGGHLGWFEVGGSRWFVKPATNFLNMMAREIDLESPFVPQDKEKVCGEAISRSKTMRKPYRPAPPEFDPMCRKLKMNLTSEAKKL